MTCPTATADTLHEVGPCVLHWTVHDERIDHRSDAYAVQTAGGWVAIDPLPLTDAARAALPPLLAIVLTANHHQRWAWELRRHTGAPVWAPGAGAALDEDIDHGYADGDSLPGGLLAVATPGPKGPHFAILRQDGERPPLVAIGDLMIAGLDGRFTVLPDEYTEDPEATRKSARQLAGEGLGMLLPAHGPPLQRDAGDAPRDAAAGA